jgi:hypothetical protein
MSNDKESKMYIEESDDGTAVVELPEGMERFDVEESAEPQQNQANDADADHPDDSDALRAAKSSRRRAKKELIRKTNEEKDLRLQKLQRENEEIKRALAEVQGKVQNYDVSRMDKQIEDQHVRLEYARMKLAEATQAGDGNEAVKAQELLYETRKQLEALEYNKRKAEQPVQQKRIDPEIQHHAANWIERNTWYKPDLSSTDSKIAKAVDEELTKEGWDATTKDYWEELDNRLQSKLPHRYNTNTERSETNRPRNVVGSSGREASAAYGGSNRTSFVLSPERVRAMKDAGAWDNPARKQKMVEKFMEYDRLNKNRSN